MSGFGFFLFDILNKFIAICEKTNDIERKKLYKEKAEVLKKSLNNFGWDGRWFKRAFMDNRRSFAEAWKAKNVK